MPKRHTGLDSIIKDLLSVLAVIIADQILNDGCVVLTNTIDVYVDSWLDIYSAFNNSDKFVQKM